MGRAAGLLSKATGDGGSRCDGEAVVVGLGHVRGSCAVVSREPAPAFLVHLKLVTAVQGRNHCPHFTGDAVTQAERLGQLVSGGAGTQPQAVGPLTAPLFRCWKGQREPKQQ